MNNSQIHGLFFNSTFHSNCQGMEAEKEKKLNKNI